MWMLLELFGPAALPRDGAREGANGNVKVVAAREAVAREAVAREAAAKEAAPREVAPREVEATKVEARKAVRKAAEIMTRDSTKRPRVTLRSLIALPSWPGCGR